MKITKKLASIILIFVVLQLFGVCFVSHISYAEDKDFIQDISDRGKAWSSMGESGSQEIIENATGVTNAINSIANVLRIACIVVFLIRIVLTGIKLSSDDSPNHKAIAKGEIVFLAVLALTFIFITPISKWLINFLNDLQSNS